MSHLALLACIWTLCGLLVAVHQCLHLPYEQYSYMLSRNKIKTLAASNSASKATRRHMSQREHVVELHLEHMKLAEYERTSEHFYAFHPIESTLPLITASPLYDELRSLPKGGQLHVHEDQMLARLELLRLIQASPLYDFLHICDTTTSNPECAATTIPPPPPPEARTLSGNTTTKTNATSNATPGACSCPKHYMRYYPRGGAPDKGWLHVKSSLPTWTVEAIANRTTLIGALNARRVRVSPSDTGKRWQVATDAFRYYTDLINENTTYFMYLRRCLDLSLADAVQYVELRSLLFEHYRFDEASGERVAISTEETLDTLRRFRAQYKRQRPELIDFTFVINAMRSMSRDNVRKNIRRVVELQRLYPDLIRGYDLVGEEVRNFVFFLF